MSNTTVSVSSNSLIKEFLKKVYSYRIIYVICLVLFITVAFLFNKYSKNIYEVNASVLLNQDNQSNFLASGDLFKGAGILKNNINIENELNMFASFSLVSSTITSLSYEVGYFLEEDKLVKLTKELHKESPFTVSLDKSHVQPINVNFYINILNDSTYRLSASQERVALYNYVDNKIEGEVQNFNINQIGKFNQTINTRFFGFVISREPNVMQYANSPKIKYYFRLHHLDYLTMQYLRSMQVYAVSPLASIMNITFKGENMDKITTFLNRYIDFYLNANLERKNRESVSTIKFIDAQISQISDSLVSSESELRSYRTANQVTDLSFQGQRLFDQMTQIETERANLQIQQRYYNYIIDYFNRNNDMSSVVPPSAMNIADPVMNQLITELIALNTQRASILSGSSQKNLFLGQVENKIKTQKESIMEIVKNNLNTVNLSIKELNYRYNKLSGEISNLPKTEIKMVGMERKFKLNDAIYTFLLQKRAEAEIARESNSPDYVILNPAREITSQVIFPTRRINYLVAFFLALLIPTLFIIFKDFINDKLVSTYEVEHISKHKVLGAIFKNKHKSATVVADRPRSSVAESFRTLRTNLLIKHNGASSHLILLTSSVPGEGKTFVSLNLAASIASMGNKTLIIDCDLRRPVLHNKLNIENSIGLSTFLVNKAPIDDIILNTFIPNLFFIPAGPLLPNPAELLESNVSNKLFNQLKSIFDYIIIDGSPIGVVADSSLLMKHATLNLLVVRYNFTKKEVLVNTIHSLETNGLKNFEIVFNDVTHKKGDYGYYYGDYYNEEERTDKKKNQKWSDKRLKTTQ